VILASVLNIRLMYLLKYILSCLILAAPCIIQARIWTDNQGRSFGGELVSQDEKYVTIQRTEDDKQFTISKDILSDADQRYLASKLSNIEKVVPYWETDPEAVVKKIKESNKGCLILYRRDYDADIYRRFISEVVQTKAVRDKIGNQVLLVVVSERSEFLENNPDISVFGSRDKFLRVRNIQPERVKTVMHYAIGYNKYKRVVLQSGRGGSTNFSAPSLDSFLKSIDSHIEKINQEPVSSNHDSIIKNGDFEHGNNNWKGDRTVKHETAERKNKICFLEVDNGQNEFFQQVKTNGVSELYLHYNVKKSEDYKGAGYEVRFTRNDGTYRWYDKFAYGNHWVCEHIYFDELENTDDIIISFKTKEGGSGYILFDEVCLSVKE